MSDIELDQVTELALRLSPAERLRLVERVVSSVGRELTADSSQTEHWGQHVISLLESLDLSEWQQIDDPVQWVRQQRREQDTRRLGDWGVDE